MLPLGSIKFNYFIVFPVRHFLRVNLMYFIKVYFLKYFMSIYFLCNLPWEVVYKRLLHFNKPFLSNRIKSLLCPAVVHSNKTKYNFYWIPAVAGFKKLATFLPVILVVYYLSFKWNFVRYVVLNYVIKQIRAKSGSFLKICLYNLGLHFTKYKVDLWWIY